MSIWGYIWFGVFGLACPIGMAVTSGGWGFLSLLLIPLLYGLARSMFWSL